MNQSALFSPAFQQAWRAAYDQELPRAAQSVAGGLSHQMWRLETGRESWALKVLSARAVGDEAGRARLEQSEQCAWLAARGGLPAVVARRGSDGRFLQLLDGDWAILYPWRAGKTLPPDAATPAIAAQMGAHLGSLHALRLRFPGQNAPAPEAFATGHWEALAARGARGAREGADWALALARDLPALVEANARAMQAQNALRVGWVTGHLDFDQKNVLWHDGAPLILDWESAKAVHPALEAVGAGLSWAGQSAGAANAESFRAFLRGYATRNALRPEDLALACDGVLGKWLIWLEFNLRRSLESGLRGTPEAVVCRDALWHALGVTLKLREDGPLYRGWLQE